MGPAVGHVDRRQTCWHQQQKLDWLVYTLSRIQSVHAVSISFVVLNSFQIARKYLLGSRSTFINLAWAMGACSCDSSGSIPHVQKVEKLDSYFVAVLKMQRSNEAAML